MAKKKPIPNQQKDVQTNRAKDIRRDNDDVTNFGVGLYELDESIKYYFDNVIRPQVRGGTGGVIQVPVIYGDPEKWKSAQKAGFHRDKDGKAQVPLILFRRSSIEKDRSLSRNYDHHDNNLYQVFENLRTKENRYDRFSALVGSDPIREFHRVVVPSYVNITYECIVWTEYIEQMNDLIEAIEFASDKFWGDPERWKFAASIDSFDSNDQVEVGEDRLIKTTFSILLKGYIIPESLQRQLSQQSQKIFSARTVIFDEKLISQDSQVIPLNPSFPGPIQAQYALIRNSDGSYIVKLPAGSERLLPDINISSTSGSFTDTYPSATPITYIIEDPRFIDTTTGVTRSFEYGTVPSYALGGSGNGCASNDLTIKYEFSGSNTASWEVPSDLSASVRTIFDEYNVASYELRVDNQVVSFPFQITASQTLDAYITKTDSNLSASFFLRGNYSGSFCTASISSLSGSWTASVPLGDIYFIPNMYYTGSLSEQYEFEINPGNRLDLIATSSIKVNNQSFFNLKPFQPLNIEIVNSSGSFVGELSGSQWLIPNIIFDYPDGTSGSFSYSSSSYQIYPELRLILKGTESSYEFITPDDWDSTFIVTSQSITGPGTISNVVINGSSPSSSYNGLPIPANATSSFDISGSITRVNLFFD